MSAGNVRVSGNVFGHIVTGDRNIVGNEINILTPGPDGNHVVTMLGPAPTIRLHHLSISQQLRPHDNFIGRRDELLIARRTLVQGRSFAFQSEPTWGRTSLLRVLGYDNYDFLQGIVYLDVEGVPEQDVVQRIFMASFTADKLAVVLDAQLRMYISSISALIMLDNLDFSADRIDALLDLMPQSVFLFTSRRYERPNGVSVHSLKGLNDYEGVELVERVLDAPLNARLRAVVRAVCGINNGNPTSIIRAAAHLGGSETAWAAFHRECLAARSSGPLLTAILPQLEQREVALIRLLAAAQRPIDQMHLASILGLSSAEPVLQSLNRRGLVIQVPGTSRYQLTSDLQSRIAEGTSLDREREVLLAMVTQAVQQAPDRQKRALADAPVILALGNWASENGRYKELQALTNAVDGPLTLASQWQSGALLLEKLLPRALERGDLATAGWVQHQQGTRAFATGNFEMARPLLEKAEQLRLRAGDQRGANLTRYHLEQLPAPPVVVKIDKKPPRSLLKTGIIATVLVSGIGLLLLLVAGAAILAYSLYFDSTPPTPVLPVALISPTASLTFVPDTLPPAPVVTPTMTASLTPSPTSTGLPTATPTWTSTPTWTPDPTWTSTPTWTPDPTPTWTPTPTASPAPIGLIAFSSDRSGDREIYTMDPDGTNLQRLTNSSGDDNRPDWSSNGGRIAFDSVRDGNWEIYTMGAGGTGQTRLTNDPGNDFNPDWSPDDSRIAFESNRDGDYDVYVMSDTGSGLVNLTNNSALDAGPDWSPNGNEIAFTSDRNGNLEIYVMNANGTNVRRLTNNSATDNRPQWSPDGTKIAFQSNRDGNDDIYVMDADGSNVRRLTNSSAEDWGPPSWGRNGHWLTFLTRRDNNWEIYIMGIDGVVQINLTNFSGYDAYPSWRKFEQIVE